MQEVLQAIENLRADVLATQQGLKEMRSLIEDRPVTRKRKEPSPDQPRCTGTTAKGTQCTNRRLPNCETCKMHMPGRQIDKTNVSKKEKQSLSKPSQHSHAAGSSTNVPCEESDAHGDVLDPDLPDIVFSPLDENDINAKLMSFLNDASSTDF